VGKGVPDLLVARQGRNYLLEVKAPSGDLTPDQVKFHADWRGQIAIVRTKEEAWRAVGLKVFSG
jgi:hypothetical protein